MRHVLLAFFLAQIVAISTFGSSARADDASRWLFVPVLSSERELPPWMASALDELAVVAEQRGLAVWPRDEAARHFERAHSSEASPVGQEDLRTLERLSDSAVKSMAGQHHAVALHELDAATRLYERSPDEFNRLAPQLVLDLCLFYARALVETGTAIARVKASVRACRVRIPLEIEPNLLTHTNATIRNLLADVAAELALSRSGKLEVRGAEGCPVRIDGVEVGRLHAGAVQFDRLLVGPHRVSVPCDNTPARIYSVEVTSAGTRLQIDSALDARVHSRPYLYLRERDLALSLDALARVLSAVQLGATVVLVQMAPDGAVVLRRIAPQPGAASTARLPAPAQVGEVWSVEQRTLAMAELLRVPDPASRSAVAPQRQASAPARSRGLWSHSELRRWSLASHILLAVGGAGAATSTALHLRARGLRRDHRTDYERYRAGGLRDTEVPAAVSRALKLGHASSIIAAGQTIWFTAFGSGFLLGRIEHRLPNTMWMVSASAVGVALLGASVYTLSGVRSSDGRSQQAIDNQRELGVLLATHGAGALCGPLLTALMFYVPWRILDRRRAPQMAWGVMPDRVQLRGNF